MPSTYTVNLGIEKPATGEQSGTWGDTTNTNFDILDQGINGAVRVTLSSAGSSGSPNALQITNGAASDGRNKWIEFYSSGDLGGSAYVQLDPNDAEKIVFVRNSLASSRSVILFQGTYNAARDLEVPAGVDMVVKFDGGGASAATVTDVYTNLRVTALTTPSLTATTADINGGTVDNAVIGGSTPAALTATTIVANTSLNIAGDGATVTGIKDEDNMSSNSATKLATQQSIKAYVDSQVGTVDTLAEILANGNTSGSNNLIINNGQALTSNTINETTAGSGVTIDSVLLKDDVVNATDVETGSISANDGTASATIANSTGNFTITNFISNSVDIGGGAIDGTVIGGASAAAGSFTTLDASGAFTGTTATLTTADNNPQLTLISTDADASVGPILKLYRNSASPADNDAVGRLLFTGEDDAGNEATYARIETIATDVSNGSENAKMEFYVAINDTFNPSLTLEDTGAATFSSTLTTGGDFLAESSASIDSTVRATGNNTRALGNYQAHTSAGADINMTLGVFGDASRGEISTATNHTLRLYVNNTPSKYLEIGTTGQVFTSYGMIVNEDSNDSDFRVESNNLGHALFVDASADKVGINDSSPSHLLTVKSDHATNPAIKIEQTGNTDGWGLIANNNEGNLEFSRIGGGTEGTHLTISNVGKVLIGDVASHTSDLLQIETPASGGGHGIQIRRNDSNTSQGIGHILFGNNTDTDLAKLAAGTDGATDAGYLVLATQATGDSLTDRLTINSQGNVVFNETGTNSDFRVESDLDTHMLFVDASTNRVGINRSSPDAPLHLQAGSSGGSLSDAFQISDSSYVNIAMYSGGADGEIRIGAAGSLRGSYKAQYAGTRSAHDFHIGTNSTNMLSFDGGGSVVVVNEAGADRDFRVEGDSNANMFVVDASNDTIGIGTQPNNNNLSPAMHFVNGGTMFGYGDAMYITGNTYYNNNWKAIATGGGANAVIDSLGFKVYNNASASANATVSPLLHLTVGPSEMVINDDSYDYDFRVESDSLTHALFVDASTNNVIVGTSNNSQSAGDGVKLKYYGAVQVVNDSSTGGGDAFSYYSSSGGNYRFWVNANGQIAAVFTSITSLSDQRLKENIRDLDDGLSKVMQLQPRKFDWKEGKGKNIANDRGFIAQEFEQVFPDLIDEWKDEAPEGEEPYKSVSADLIPTLVKAIQEQNELIEDLRARVAQLENT